jgi:hypothetical protein
MKDNRMGGIALVAGSVAGIITMALHPTGHDLMAPGRFAHTALLGAAVHALAIASLPVSFLGAWALTRRLDAPDRLAGAALVVYGFGLAAALAAASVSGFVAPPLVRALGDASSPESDTWRIVFHYNGLLNQAFAQVYAVASSMAIVLWSASMVKRRALAPGAGIYGLVAGSAVALLVLAGHLRLDVHGMGLVVVAQAIWFLVVGVRLYRLAES